MPHEKDAWFIGFNNHTCRLCAFGTYEYAQQRTTVKQTKLKDVREEIWLQLSKESKEEIVGSWQRGNLPKVTIESANQFQGAEKYIGNELLMASFRSKEPSLEEVVVFVDPQTHQIVGTGLSD